MKVLSLHITDTCNNHCSFCVVGVPQLHGDTVDIRRLYSLLLRHASGGYDAVNLHGGEPTVHPDFLSILRFIRDLGYPEVHLQTNGQALQDPAFTAELLALNVRLCVVSLHGAWAETHDAVTGTPGCFAAAVRGITQVKRLYGRVQTNTVVLRENMHELTAIIDLAKELGVDRFNLSNLHPAESAYLQFERLAPTVAESRRWVAEAVRHAARRGLEISLEGFPCCLVPGAEHLRLNRRDSLMQMEIRGNWLENYEQFMDKVCRRKGAVCRECRHEPECGGVYREYIEKRGWSEFEAVMAEDQR